MMNAKLLKTSALSVLFLLLGVFGLVPSAFAAEPGTCVIIVNHDETLNKIGDCVSFIGGKVDSNGKKVDPTKCYLLSEFNGTADISQELNCADKRFLGAKAPAKGSQTSATSTSTGGNLCGSGESQTKISIDIGCKSKGNAITDALFAIIRFLTNGVGVVLVASMVYAGIQYSSSRGDPSGTQAAINRIRANVFALLLFAFAYALLNYLIPGTVLHS